MAYGSSSLGSSSLGGACPREIQQTKFDIEKEVDNGQSIIVVSDLFGSKLIEYFRKNPTELKLMNRRKFEELVAELFQGFGYKVELTQQTRDGGKDIIAIGNINDVCSKYLIECKRPDPGNAVGVGVVRELMGVKVDERATQAIAVTTTHFSPEAHAFQERNKWELELKEYNDLAKWIQDYASLHG